jgi:hypothetical protein
MKKYYLAFLIIYAASCFSQSEKDSLIKTHLKEGNAGEKGH